ncbi:hypothetical protein RhiirC2_846812 [Rhizophagus irregularis]|uniref:Uncharacterized protein n=1 Tax=Rhizophagus irregularis TaxID=588596 RepID=A0A2N1NKT7_9GLOM|nr:hypothetical protein RhiirC2_846812 [Rhizophagus irregularis]
MIWKFRHIEKRSRKLDASTKKSSNKKVKKADGKKVLSILKKLINIPDSGSSLEETSESASNFLQLSERIDNAELKMKMHLKIYFNAEGLMSSDKFVQSRPSFLGKYGVLVYVMYLEYVINFPDNRKVLGHKLSLYNSFILLHNFDEPGQVCPDSTIKKIEQ